jgi:uncharacterized membrane protein
MKKTLLLLLPLPIAACAPLPDWTPPPYHAVGTEPFWDVLIDGHDVTFTLSGSQPIRQPTPKVIIGFAGEIYRTPRIGVNIVHGQCGDGMSDRVFPDKVQVTVDGRQFKGCGGL